GHTAPAENSLLFHGIQWRPDHPLKTVKSAFEAEVSEISISQNEINLALRNLRAWMKDEKVSKNLATQLDSAFIRKEPFGLVLILSPWNYPLNLSLGPLVGALAAGNCVVLKPSEISKTAEKVLAEVLPRYLDQGARAALWALRLGPQREPLFVHSPLQSCFAVVLGGPQETGRLLEHKFDYIFFTGEGPAPSFTLGALSPAAGERLRGQSHVSGPGPGGGKPDLPPPRHTSSLSGAAASASLLPRPCREPRTRPVSCHRNRQ
ncbi:hypothetical protein FD754_024613, partial [Muntiacus muntjak]